MNKIAKKWTAVLLFVSLAAGFCTGCAKQAPNQLNIAEQFGIAYAPLQIMKQQKLLEKRLPSVTVNWKQFGGPTAIREGMLAGEIDFGFMGPAPVLMGIDNGMKWKFATGISFNEMAIMVKNPQVQKLGDLTKNDRIAILSPACTQHVLLCMAAEQELGDANYFDSQLVSMSHPDAANALMTNTEVTAHVATPPYIGTELDAGMHSIYTGEEIMGQPFTFITGVAMEDFYRERPKDYQAFIESLNEAIDYINRNPEQAAADLAPVYGISEEELYEQMTYRGTIYSNRLEGIEKLSDAMRRMGFVKNSPEMEEMIFPNVNS